MGIYSIKPAFGRALGPVERALIRAGVSADALTAAGLVFAAAAGIGVWLGRNGGGWLVLAAACAILRTAANALDGNVARATGTQRPFGEVLNETADRLGDGAALGAFLFVPTVPLLLVAAMLVLTFSTSFLAAINKAAGGTRLHSGPMGKPDRMLLLAAAAIVALWLNPGSVFTVMLWIMVAGVALTLAIRFRDSYTELAGAPAPDDAVGRL